MKYNQMIQLTKAALIIAKRAHGDQLRAIGPDIGTSYFDGHVMRVVRASPDWAKPVAALHDVDEDTTTRLPSLRILFRGFGVELPPFILKALQLLSRREAEHYHGITDYYEYIERIAVAEGKAGKIARRVKLHDLADNINGGLEVPERYLVAMTRIAAAIHHRDQ